MATSVILMVAYGYEVEDQNDSLVLLAQEVMSSLSVAVAPNRYWVDSVPICEFFNMDCSPWDGAHL